MDCDRCGGLLVAEHFAGGDSMVGAWQYDGLRCVNCGAIRLDGNTRAHRDSLVWGWLSARTQDMH